MSWPPTFKKNPEAEFEALWAEKQREVDIINRTPNPAFQGLCPEQMYFLHYFPFTSPLSPIAGAFSFQEPPGLMAVPADLETMPLVRALRTCLAYFAGDKGEKLTPQGRLPRKLLMALYELHPWSLGGANFKPNLEEDFSPAMMLHTITVSEGWLRKAHGRLHLTKKGRKLLDSSAAEQFEAVFVAVLCRFNWAYLDGWPPFPQLQQAWSYLIWLLLRFGQEERRVSFYLDALLLACPDWSESIGPELTTFSLRAMLFTRFFDRFLHYFGWVELSGKRYEYEGSCLVRVNEQFFQHFALRA